MKPSCFYLLGPTILFYNKIKISYCKENLYLPHSYRWELVRFPRFPQFSRFAHFPAVTAQCELCYQQFQQIFNTILTHFCKGCSAQISKNLVLVIESPFNIKTFYTFSTTNLYEFLTRELKFKRWFLPMIFGIQK